MQGEGKGAFVSTYWSKLSFCRRRTELSWLLIDQPCSVSLPYCQFLGAVWIRFCLGIVMHHAPAWPRTTIEANSRFCFSANQTKSFLSDSRLRPCPWYHSLGPLEPVPGVTQSCFKIILIITAMVITFSKEVWSIISEIADSSFTHSTDGFWNSPNSLPTAN